MSSVDVMKCIRGRELRGLYPRFTPRVVAAVRVGGAQGTPAARLHPRPAREKGFPFDLLTY
jgi:hypothetical protein